MQLCLSSLCFCAPVVFLYWLGLCPVGSEDRLNLLSDTLSEDLDRTLRQESQWRARLQYYYLTAQQEWYCVFVVEPFCLNLSYSVYFFSYRVTEESHQAAGQKWVELTQKVQLKLLRDRMTEHVNNWGDSHTIVTQTIPDCPVSAFIVMSVTSSKSSSSFPVCYQVHYIHFLKLYIVSQLQV